MQNKYNKLMKVLGPLAAKLVTALYERNRPVFHFKEAQDILGGRIPANNVLQQLIRHKVVTRLKPGTYCLIPYELGFEEEYIGNPYVIARELALKDKPDSGQYYLSHASAFELHQMVTQPQFVVYITSPKKKRSYLIHGVEIRFVHSQEKNMFGLTEIWIDKHEKIVVSDLERTLIDGLKKPIYCGGFIEVAKAFLIKKEAINPKLIIDYALKLNSGAVIRRLGYLMELYQIGVETHWKALQEKITATYHLLDPELPQEGQHTAKWRLRLNINEKELLAIGET